MMLQPIVHSEIHSDAVVPLRRRGGEEGGP